MLAADYGNCGDIAITYAQRKFLKENLTGYKIIEIPLKFFYRDYLCIKKNLNPQDIITIIGGGNTGDLYWNFEEARRFIIKKFKKNKVISFLQTVDFSTKKELKKSAKIYSENRNLYLFAREKKSYNIYKDFFNTNNIFLVPDIVLSLNKNQKDNKRKNILICLRNDAEKQIDGQDEKSLINYLKTKYTNIVFQDTYIGDKIIPYNERESILAKMWKNFSSSKIVITDRLHGLIFSKITSTPCIAIDNSNNKIRETYNTWLKENKNTYFFHEINNPEIIEIIKKYNNLNEKYYDENKIDKEFTDLKNIFKIETKL